MALLMAVFYIYAQWQLPSVDLLRDVHMQVPLRVYSREGQLIAEFGSKKRTPITLSQVPKPLIQAVLAVEDARFYQHPGVDFIGLVRAARAVVASGRKVQGASTITMQVARNFFLTKKKTYARKIKEILLALKIDKTFSKDKILTLYLNKVYFGHRAYGVAAAAQIYYDRKLDELSLSQIAMLAGLPQAPSRNNPLNNPKSALKRRNHVLARMLEVGFISPQQYQIATRAPLTAHYHGQGIQVSAPYIAEMVREVMVSEYGQSAYDRGLVVVTTLSSRWQKQAIQALQNGLIAYSERHGYHAPSKNLGSPTDNSRVEWRPVLSKLSYTHLLQPAAVLEINDQTADILMINGDVVKLPWTGMSWARPAYRESLVGPLPKQASDIVKPGDVIWVLKTRKGWRLSQIPSIQGAIVSIDPKNGAILALSGGFDYELSSFNRATQAMRQSGSNFKPFLYSAALAKGFTLASIINDAPVVMQDSGENQLWRPKNDTLHFYGPTRLREGLVHSRNLVSIRLLQAIGIPYADRYIQRFGFDSMNLPKTLSLALGSGLVSPLQIAAGYAVFANGGYRVPPYFIQKVFDISSDKILFTASPPMACQMCYSKTQQKTQVFPQPIAQRVITPQNAYLLTKAMQGVIQHGTGRAVKILKRSDLAGKTGTTNDKVDAWFSGFNGNMVTTVWVGFDDSKSIYEYGAQAALPIWVQYMRQALKGMPESTMSEPPDMITVRIDPHSGLLASPNQSNSIFEIFRKQYRPIIWASSSHSNRSFSETTYGMHSNNEPLF